MIFSRTNTKYDNFRQGAHDLLVSAADASSLKVLTQEGPIQIIPDWKDDVILFTELNQKERYVGMVTIGLDGKNRRRIEGPFEQLWDGGRHGRFIPDRDSNWPYGRKEDAPVMHR